MKTILVTGGAGYIGSQTVALLMEGGYHCVILDNLSEGHVQAVPGGELVEAELSDEPSLEEVFAQHDVQAVLHFASRCSVGESVRDPRLYYEQNVIGLLTLLKVMLRHGSRRFVFSSSCAVYGDPGRIPMDETHGRDPINPYGESKYFIERILRQYERAYGLRAISLRYFNAAGASLDGRLGESHDPETHLIPLALGAASGRFGPLKIFGDDYDTKDGSCIRDYVHILDLAHAHLAALRALEQGRQGGAFNLGTGNGHSVKEIVSAVKRVTGLPVPVEKAPRRRGDPPELVCDPSKAQQILGWRARHSDLETILGTAWEWAKNPRY